MLFMECRGESAILSIRRLFDKCRCLLWLIVGVLVLVILAAAMAMMFSGHNRNWTPEIKTFDKVEMVLVPSGCFMMGSSDAEVASLIIQYNTVFFRNQSPQTNICFDAAFWIDKNLVTNAQFRRFNGRAAQESDWTEDNRPRVNITWFEAKDFCEARGSRLPSEAEWEYAARGWDSLAYPWGNTWNPANAVWSLYSGHEYPIDLSRQTANVGSRPSGVSWVGALDMAGNVWQWTTSLYSPYPYNKDDGSENNSDTTTIRVMRGGSWAYTDYYLRSAYRVADHPSASDNQIGFRCVRQTGVRSE